MDICTECKEQIKNPICPKCVAKSIEAWLMQNNKELVEVVRSKLNVFDSLNDEINSEIRCIRCNSTIDICMHCSSNEIYNWVKEEDCITAQTFPFKF